MSIFANNQDYPSVQVNARMIKILWKQQQELLKKSPDCVQPIINSEDPLDIQANIEGPKGTPYEGGIFNVKLFIPSDFPHSAPKGYFLTKIFHPNVSEKGEICVNTLKRDWNPTQWSLFNLFEVIKCLLIVPFPQSSLNEEAGKVFMENYNEYFRIAKMYTDIYALKKVNKQDSDNSKNNDKNNNSVNNNDNSKINSSNMSSNSNNLNANNNTLNINNNSSNNTIESIHNNETTRNQSQNNNEISMKIIDNLNNTNDNNMINNNFVSGNIEYNNNMSNFNNISNIQNDSGFGNVTINRAYSLKGNNCLMTQYFNQQNNIINNNERYSLNKYHRNNSILSNNNFNQYQSSKEKPNLGLFPFINNLNNNNNNNPNCNNKEQNFNFQRSNTTNIQFNSNMQMSSSDEINKWLMRI